MQIRRLEPADARDYRALMLAAYAETPSAFIGTVEEREPLPLEWWAERLAEEPDAQAATFGAFERGRLIGAAGLLRERRLRIAHKATLFGMAVDPAHRRRGAGRALVEAVLAEAGSRPGVLLVQLTVTEVNLPALRLYRACGFRTFGIEPAAIRYDGRLASLIHMWRPVGEGEAAVIEHALGSVSDDG